LFFFFSFDSPLFATYRKREEKRELGMKALQAGHKADALVHFQKAIDVTPEMAYKLIEVRERDENRENGWEVERVPSCECESVKI
jgi:hypothetical protein